jgi:uncharacterized protein YecE (DUF72 family)
MSKAGRIRVGIGGWSFEPWRETFYPPDTPQARELEYASRQVTSIEINSTFYRLQKPAVYAKWRDATPADFMFSIKAPRYLVQREELASMGGSLERFIGSGIAELGAKLGPILWQFTPAQHFNAVDFGKFLDLLPESAGQVPLRHALEVRHKSYLCAEFLVLARRRRAAVVFVDDAKYPRCADVTGDFVYARLRQCVAGEATGYSKSALHQWSDVARTWAHGGSPADLALIEPGAPAAASPRDVFVYFINGAKERAPAAAQALIAELA